jgi:hypothetical protein
MKNSRLFQILSILNKLQNRLEKLSNVLLIEIRKSRIIEEFLDY